MTRLLENAQMHLFKEGEGLSASGTIPKDLECFKDHFPNFPVLPGVLTLDILRTIAEGYLKQQSGDENPKYRVKEIKAVKFTHYLKPGECWKAQLNLLKHDAEESQWHARLYSGEKIAANSKILIQKISR